MSELRFDGKVAFVTGAARGQGRSHAVHLAQEGADIIAVDVCEQVASAPVEMATPEDLAETVAEVEAVGGRILATQTDVRRHDALKSALDAGVEEFGRLDIVAANAGIAGFGLTHELSDVEWRDMIDVNLTGVWQTAKVAIPHLLAGERGGSITLTSSVGGLKGFAHCGHYVAAKHGVVGLMRTLALELAPHHIRVNSIHPASVNTPMLMNEFTYKLFRPDLEHPTEEDFVPAVTAMHTLPIPWLNAQDISKALLFLASDDARYITGVALPVDGGAGLK
jgi:(+)-trans-carveol dehydrogenase